MSENLTKDELEVIESGFRSAINAARKLKSKLKQAGYGVYAAGIEEYIRVLSGTKKQIKEDNQ